MYSIEYYYQDPFAGPKMVTPKGQHVSVITMRIQGAKVTLAELAATEPLIGYIRKTHDTGERMAYRYNGTLVLETGEYQPRKIACLHSPVLQEWNKDGQIYQGWVLEKMGDDKLHQVIQLWWIRQLEGLSAKPVIGAKSPAKSV